MFIKKSFREYVMDENGLPKSFPSFGKAYIEAVRKGKEWVISGTFGVGYHVYRTVTKSLEVPLGGED